MPVNIRRARWFYRLSMAMIALAFFLFVAIIVLLFVLFARNAFVCGEQLCYLSDDFTAQYITFGLLIAAIGGALGLAGYFQRFFLEPRPPKPARSTTNRFKSIAAAPKHAETPPRRIEVPQFVSTDDATISPDPTLPLPTTTPNLKPARTDMPREDTKKEKSHEAKPAPSKVPTTHPRKHDALDMETTRKRRTQAHTKEDIARIVATRTALPVEVARAFIDDTFSVISDALSNHEKVAIHQFGTFTTSKLKARTINVPSKPDEASTIPAHHVVRFKHSPAFEAYLNDAHATAPPIAPDDRAVVTGVPREASREKPATEPEALSKRDVLARVTAQTGIEKPALDAFYEALTETLKGALANNDTVRLYGFGTFETVTHDARTVVIPSTGETKRIPAVRDVRFRPGNAFIAGLQDKLNES